MVLNFCRALLVAAAIAMGSVFATGQLRYAGGDISLLPAYEQAGATYLSYDGKPVSGSALDFFAGQGLNIMRVRLFVDPDAFTGRKDPNACQSLEYIIPICRRITDLGLPLMLDFHYSDTWADPASQWTPTAWASLSDEQLYQQIYDYTLQTLQTLKAEGITPSHIATGNEISYGMLWGAYGAAESSLKKCFQGSDANWNRFTTLLKRAGEACREVFPDAKIVLHTERVAAISTMDNFYRKMQSANVDYDVIGLSYYPYWHGPLANLEAALTNCENLFPDKEVMVVEAGYPYKWEVPGSTYDYTSVYPYSEEGQKAYTHDLVEVLLKHPHVNGLIWWWPEYNAYGTNLSGWYNAPLFNSQNGRACPALKELTAYANTLGLAEALTQNTETESQWYNMLGQPVNVPCPHGFYITKGSKLLFK